MQPALEPVSERVLRHMRSCGKKSRISWIFFFEFIFFLNSSRRKIYLASGAFVSVGVCGWEEVEVDAVGVGGVVVVELDNLADHEGGHGGRNPLTGVDSWKIIPLIYFVNLIFCYDP